MELDKDIGEMLQKINPKQEPQIIKKLVEEFIYEIMWSGVNVNVPIPFEKYRFCLLESQESFIAYLSKERVGFIDELTVGHLWDYRYHLDTIMNPYDRTIYVIAVRKFMMFCHQNGCLDKEISDSMQLVKDNKLYVPDMDPMSSDILDIL